MQRHCQYRYCACFAYAGPNFHAVAEATTSNISAIRRRHRLRRRGFAGAYSSGDKTLCSTRLNRLPRRPRISLTPTIGAENVSPLYRTLTEEFNTMAKQYSAPVDQKIDADKS